MIPVKNNTGNYEVEEDDSEDEGGEKRQKDGQ